ncbi:helix-turn-helix domain-containing protein [Viridibacillus arvi]|uniref:Resolvase HTH domain-containing protein n=1 Tax=Viridibacillus arvi TaxID=263475 RepID=A0A0M0LD26_9BACL|nr:helix-turn-helix domain-containing protein [Viridibacillus arvi]KOO48964.1 hypothetical protein AMD00_11195 [Viridibacillus arvi]
MKPTETNKMKAIRELWDAKMTPKEIAEVMGLHVATIHRILVRIGAKEKNEQVSKRLTAEQKEDIVKLYQEGMTIEEIMDTVGCSKPTIYSYVNKAGLSRDIPKETIDTAIDLYINQKMVVPEILKKVGISKATFYRKLKKYEKEQGSNKLLLFNDKKLTSQKRLPSKV